MHLRDAGTLWVFLYESFRQHSNLMQLNFHWSPPHCRDDVINWEFLLSRMHCLDVFAVGFCVSVGTCMGHMRTPVP